MLVDQEAFVAETMDRLVALSMRTKSLEVVLLVGQESIVTGTLWRLVVRSVGTKSLELVRVDWDG